MATEYFVQDVELKLVEAEELIKGYVFSIELSSNFTAQHSVLFSHMYGTTPVPFDQSLGLKFDGGGKCFRCIGFTNRDNIHDHHLTGSGAWMVVPQKGASASEKLFVALVNVMKSSEFAMIVRYVYRSGTKPKIMALVAHPDAEKNECKRIASLMMMELHFAGEF